MDKIKYILIKYTDIQHIVNEMFTHYKYVFFIINLNNQRRRLNCYTYFICRLGISINSENYNFNSQNLSDFYLLLYLLGFL